MRHENGIRHLKVTMALAAALTAGSSGIALAADEDVSVFDWAGYEDPGFHPDYVKKHGDSPSFSFFGDEDEAFEKLRAGFTSDLAHPCSQNVVKWRDAGLLQPLDPARIDAWEEILPGLKSMNNLMTDGEGTAWFVPFEWGNTLVTYRTDKVDEADIQSLKAFADPKFQGRVSMPDNVDDAYALAALATGHTDWTKMTDADWDAASAFLREVHKNVRLYWLDNTELSQAMAGGEVDLAWAWNETATTLMADGVPAAMKRDTDEGLSTWVCGYVHLKDAPGNTDKVYDYLNAILTPEVATYLVNDWGYGHANATGMAKIDPEVLESTGYGDLEAFVDKTLFNSPLPPETKSKLIEEFERIKAGY
ncbi:extracellular solute-binding protein [Mesorhizobium sp. CAU 1741]|uniref:extracellular solute-binding protein n=1 Tax=Mesorhizobium sp. CAU 1741 TaxID=3140366 RepID=UPI00325B6921